MGYFKKSIRRGISRAVVRGAATLKPPRGWAVAPSIAPASDQKVVLRFAVSERDLASNQPSGIFHAALDLLESGALDRDETNCLAEARTWFNENLHSPDLDEPRAIFWFKSSAVECVARIWDHIRLLREHDRQVLMLKTDRPGRVVFEDEHQVAAIPHRDAEWNLRRF